jgi:hypothetical protein
MRDLTFLRREINKLRGEIEEKRLQLSNTSHSVSLFKSQIVTNGRFDNDLYTLQEDMYQLQLNLKGLQDALYRLQEELYSLEMDPEKDVPGSSIFANASFECPILPDLVDTADVLQSSLLARRTDTLDSAYFSDPISQFRHNNYVPFLPNSQPWVRRRAYLGEIHCSVSPSISSPALQSNGLPETNDPEEHFALALLGSDTIPVPPVRYARNSFTKWIRHPRRWLKLSWVFKEPRDDLISDDKKRRVRS